MERISKISRFYLFHGEDEYSKMKKVKSLIDSVITKGFEDFDYHYFEGRGLDAPALINAASSPPFGSPIRVILLRNFDKVSPKGQELISRFIGLIPEYTTLVMTCGKIEGNDKRKKVFKTLLADKKTCIEFGLLPPDKISAIIRQTADELQIKIEPQALEYLIETIGNNIGILEQELIKLGIYVGPDNSIKESDIAQLTGAGIIGTVYDLPVKIAQGSTAEALRLLNNLLLTKEGEGTILFRIKEFFLRLNMAKVANASLYSLMKDFHLFKKTAEILTMFTQKLSFGCIISCLHYIYECEIGLKSAGMKKNIILIDLVSRLCVEVNGE